MDLTDMDLAKVAIKSALLCHSSLFLRPRDKSCKALNITKTMTIQNSTHQSLCTLLYGNDNKIDLCLDKSFNCLYELLTEQQETIYETEKDLAILFLDIRHFTDLLESQPAKEILRLVGRLFTVFSKVITSFKGRVVEKTGDNLYAVFGLQEDLREATNNAYKAAKMMFEALNILNENYSVGVSGNPLEMGLGMHTGHVYVGQFESGSHAPMTVMGLPVNIASRLQAETKVQNNDLILSEDAYQLLDESIVHELRTVRLRGVRADQLIRLAGKPFTPMLPGKHNELDLAFLMAISG